MDDEYPQVNGLMDRVDREIHIVGNDSAVTAARKFGVGLGASTALYIAGGIKIPHCKLLSGAFVGVIASLMGRVILSVIFEDNLAGELFQSRFGTAARFFLNVVR